jgi:hypothetical protein
VGAINAFFGYTAGVSNTVGANNAFFGSYAGRSNTTGQQNAFFGSNAGAANTSAFNNAFFGYSAGEANTVGDNAFFGSLAGLVNTTGNENTFLGSYAGGNNTTGIRNTFAGFQSGGCQDVSQCPQRLTGTQNSFFGYKAGFTNSASNFNNFFGAFAGYLNMIGSGNNFFGSNAGGNNLTGSSNTIIGDLADVGTDGLNHATAIGAGVRVTASNRVQIGRTPDQFQSGDTVAIGAFGTPASPPIAVCINLLGVFTSCSSSLRYKTTIQPFHGGLSLIQRLRPITFAWKESGLLDIGLAAEEVAAVDDRFIFRDPKGQIEGVRYTQLSVLFINAFKEQQAQLENQQTQIREHERQAASQQTQIEQSRKQLAAQQARITEQGVKLAQQQRDIDALKQLFCSAHPRARVCRAARPKK